MIRTRYDHDGLSAASEPLSGLKSQPDVVSFVTPPLQAGSVPIKAIHTPGLPTAGHRARPSSVAATPW